MTLPTSNSLYSAGRSGTASTDALLTILSDRDPTTSDINYQPTQKWVNTTTGAMFMLQDFPVTLGIVFANWINISNPGGVAIDSIAVQTGVSPIEADSGGEITFNGAVVAAGTNPVRTDGIDANTVSLEVQLSQAIAAADATKVGLSNFNSIQFSVDADGFVALTSGGLGVTTAQGTAPITVNGASGTPASGAITIAANNATQSTTGVANFPSPYFTVSSGAVTPSNFTINTSAPLSGGGSITLGGTLNLSISGSGFVSSITGTANQIEANNTVGVPQTGAVTLDFTNGISIGSFQATPPPNGGMLVPGRTFIGNTVSRFGSTPCFLEVTGTHFAAGTLACGIASTNTFPSSVNSIATCFFSAPLTAAAAFNISTMIHYRTLGVGLGAGSTVSSQIGFEIASNFPTATQNLGFVGSMSVNGTANYNAYMNGTAPNYFEGSVGIGTAVPLSKVDINGNLAVGSFAGTSSAPTNGAAISGILLVGTATIGTGSSSTLQAEVVHDAVYNSNVDTGQFRVSGATAQINTMIFGVDTTSFFGWIQPVTQGVAFRNLLLCPTGASVGIGGSGVQPLSKLDVFGNVAIGTFAGTAAAPSNGMIVSGPISQGTSIILSQLQSVNNQLYTGNEVSPHGFQTFSAAPTSGVMTMFMGCDMTNTLSYIQSINFGVAQAPLTLNAQGGSVYLVGGITTATAKFSATNTGIFSSVVTGVTVTGAAVLIDATTGQFGTVVSSKRYKENVQSLDRSIMDLQPVKFNYIGKKEECYGLIAEDVDAIFPELVVHKDGRPETVKYHEMPALLLAEIQRLNKRIEILEKRR